MASEIDTLLLGRLENLGRLLLLLLVVALIAAAVGAPASTGCC